MLLPLVVIVAIWQMLFPRWLMLLPLFMIVTIGRCYCQVADVVATDCDCCNLADVVSKVADVTATVYDSYHWQMLLPSG